MGLETPEAWAATSLQTLAYRKNIEKRKRLSVKACYNRWG